MKKENWCSECGAMVAAHAPEGLCPRCLLKQGVSDMPVSDVDGDSDAAGVIIKTVEETGGRYTHLGEFAKGGMGRVLIVHDEHLERDVALKELLLGKVESSGGQATPVSGSIEVVGRFLREARITDRLEHPSITPVYELGHRKDGTLYYTMKLVRGQTLQKAIRDAGSFEERLRLLPHFVDLCQAIAYAHSRGVIHRDIKPANVMIGEFGETVVIDWGLAKAKGQQDDRAKEITESVLRMQQGKEEEDALTEYGQVMGTPAYMPPEQAKGDLDMIDERSDIYSLGAVLYEILTGQTPFVGLSVASIVYHVINEEPESIRRLVPKCPPDLITFCERAMRKNPEKRFQSAKTFAEAVENSKLRPPISRIRRFVQACAVLLVLGTIAAIAAANWLSDRKLAKAYERMEAAGVRTRMPDPAFALPRFVGRDKLPERTAPTSFELQSNGLGVLYALPKLFPGLVTMEEMDWEYLASSYKWGLSAEQLGRLRERVTQQAPLLAKLHEYSKLPAPSDIELLDLFRQDNDNPKEPFSGRDNISLFLVRRCANLLAMEAELAAYENRPEDAVQIVLALLKFAEPIKERLFIFERGSYNVCTWLAKNILKQMPADMPISPNAMGELRDAFTRRMQMTNSVLDTMPRVTLLHFDYYRKYGVNPFGRTLAFDFFDTDPESLSFRKRVGYWLFFKLYDVRLFRFWMNTDQAAYMTAVTDAIEAKRLPYPEAKKRLDALQQRYYASSYSSTPLYHSLDYGISNFTIGDYLSCAGLRQSMIDLAIREFVMKEKCPPKTLSELKGALPAKIFVDPMTEQQFHYEANDKEYWIVSAGEDGQCADLSEVKLFSQGILETLFTTLDTYSSDRGKKPARNYYAGSDKVNTLTGTFPDSLEVLVPQYLEAIPQPASPDFKIHYESTPDDINDRFKLYFVNKDGNRVARPDDIVLHGFIRDGNV